ncbi:MAG TPA: putative molybdenum carrier protein [Methylomirabilota bacterium]|nr:putative molybdenum carrier protein [Methylomirabilota bacterium]
MTAGRGAPKIVSGGQTGADRAALDWAVAHGVSHGGWCPRGRLAEDGVIPARYRLAETPAGDYAQRTEWNVRDSDGTAVLSMGETLSGGSRATAELARAHGRPWVHLSAGLGADAAAERLREFVRIHDIRVLNVAGPRASHEPGVGEFVRAVLDRAFGAAGG